MKRYSAVAVAALALLTASISHANLITYSASLSGAAESPTNNSPGTGSALITIDTVTNMMHVIVSFAGLVAPNTASHIHCCTALQGVSTAGVATVTPTFTGFPTGTTSGSYDHFFDLTLASSWNPAFITANGGTTASAEAVLIAGLAAGQAYLNIHSQTFPSGEIRGFLTVPEPGTLALIAAGLIVVGWLKRRGR